MKAGILSIPALKDSSVILEDETALFQLRQHPSVSLFIRTDDRVKMDPAGQITERRGVALRYLGDKSIDVVAGGDIELSHELPVYGVFDDDIPDLTPVVDQNTKFFFHILRSVPAGDPSDDPVTDPCQDIAPRRRGDIRARCPKKRDVPHDDLTADPEHARKSARGHRAAGTSEHLYYILPS